MSKVPEECMFDCTEPCPFCTFNDEPAPRDHIPDCSECGHNGNVVPDYGMVDCDERIPEEVRDEGKTPFNCLGCGNSWMGDWNQ